MKPFNPYAFPVGFHPEGNNADQMGMGLRDYFAAKAMEGDWASQSEAVGGWMNHTPDEDFERRARVYYRLADAMLKVREE
jgi:hypothetical protein